MQLLTRLLVLCGFLSVSSAFAQQDPTRPSDYSVGMGETATTVQTQGVSVDAIFISAAKRIAVINGVPVTIGQQQAGVKLIAINSDNIIVEQMIDGVSQQRTISVNSTGEVKKNATNNF